MGVRCPIFCIYISLILFCLSFHFVLSNWHLSNVEQKSDLLQKSHQCMNVQEQIHGLLDIYLCLIFTVPKKCSWRGVLDTTLCDKMFMARCTRYNIM